VMAALALALRFVPYSDDRGNFDPEWTALMAVFLAIALAASVYLVVVLEILKLRGVRFRQLAEDHSHLWILLLPAFASAPGRVRP